MTLEVSSLTIRDICDGLRDKAFSCEELTRGYLAEIEARDETLGCFNEVWCEAAMARAKQVDAGEVSGALAGVPIAVKDNMCTKVGKTTCSSQMLAEFESPYDATVIEKLNAAGAVVLGKLNMDEFAMGSSNENSSMGVVKNPWSVEHVPGGSSGGSAAAVGAGLVAGALGSDTGGSIRQPAAYCGVVGMKPTYGLVSRFGLVAYASSLDQIGPVGGSVEDAGLLLNAIVGHDARDSTSAPDEVSGRVGDYTAGLNEGVKGLRIGIAKQYVSDANSAAVNEMIAKAEGQYREMGAEIVEVDLPHTEYGIATYYIVATAEASSNLARYDGVHYGHRTANPEDLIDLYAASRAEGFGDEVKRRIMLGTYALSSGYYDAYYLRALKVRRLIKQDFDAAFEKCDAIVCPTTTGAAFKIGENVDDPLQMYLNDVYTVNCNLAGIPGISLPGGFDESGGVKLPLGLQLLGPTFSEAKLLKIARMFEQANEFRNQRVVRV